MANGVLCLKIKIMVGLLVVVLEVYENMFIGWRFRLTQAVEI